MSDLSLYDSEFSGLQQRFPQLASMVSGIQKMLPEMNRARENFGKTQSQYMDNMLTLSFPTPLRNLHQILAQVEQIRNALREGYFKRRKTEVELKIKRKRLMEEGDDLQRELLQIELEETEAELEAGNLYISGAVRRLANYSAQYEAISIQLMKEQGVESFDELDFEKAEEKYHIMRAFEQGLCAARSHGGIVDEGNQIYFYQIGINGGAAQHEVRKFLHVETMAIEKGLKIEHNIVREFLEEMAKKFEGCSRLFANYKGMKGIVDEALLIKAS